MLRESALRRLRLTPSGFCIRITVNETLINHEKTTSKVIYVILINKTIYVIAF